jgi:hypothetical protein
LLKNAPSLKARWNDSFVVAWEFALKTVRKEYRQIDFPDRWQYPSDLDAILDRNFWKEEES